MTQWPPGLLDAFTAYEIALAEDDVPTLDALFAPGPDTLRADAAGLLVGHDRIAAFRSSRGGVARRSLGVVEVRPIADHAVLVVAESLFDGGGRGLQTQLWQRTEELWRITAAHVSGRPRAFDPSIWRALGDPLVRGASAGPLAGVRVAVKDLFAVAGFVVGAGNPTWERDAPVATASASAVRALLDAGADVTGIARTDEFAYSIAGRNHHTGTPPNGAAPGRLPGGSTSGPASAVAAGFADLALGTDTGGSVRVPASYQGLWGLRTTHGVVDRSGLQPLAESFDTVGWLARSAGALRAAAAVSLPPEDRPGTATSAPELVVDPQLVAAADRHTVDAFTDWLRAQDLVTHVVHLPDVDELAEVLRVVQAAEAWRNNGAWVSEHPDALGPDVAERFQAAAAVTAGEESAARRSLTRLRARVRETLGGRALCLPSVPGPAPLLTEADAATVQATRRATLRMCSVAGIGGLPAVSAPLLAVDGAPVGVCLVGPVGSDLALIDLARSWTQDPAPSTTLNGATPWRQ